MNKCKLLNNVMVPRVSCEQLFFLIVNGDLTLLFLTTNDHVLELTCQLSFATNHKHSSITFSEVKVTTQNLAYHANKVCVACLPMCGMILMHYLYDMWHVFHRKVACFTHGTKIWWKFDRIWDTLMWITSLKHQILRELLDLATGIYNAFCDWYVPRQCLVFRKKCSGEEPMQRKLQLRIRLH